MRRSARAGQHRASGAHGALVVGPTLPTADLALLTSALDDSETDLREALVMLAENLGAAVSSFVGVTITVILDGVAVTLSASDPHLAGTPVACLNQPVSLSVPDVIGPEITFYAADVAALADLAGVVTRSVGAREPVTARESEAPTGSGQWLGVSGLAEFSARNQAIGVLIDQGYCPDEARIELRRRATRDEATVDETAQDTLRHLAAASTWVDTPGHPCSAPRSPQNQCQPD